MPDIEVSTLDPALQKHYDEDYPELVYNNDQDPGLKYLETVKEEDAGGQGIVVDIIDRGSVQASPDYGYAGGAFGVRKFDIPMNVLHWKASLTQESLDAAKKKGGRAVFDVQKQAIDMAFQEVFSKLAYHFMGRRGEIGHIAAINGATITLGNDSAGTGTGTADSSLLNRLREGQSLVAADLYTGNQRGASVGGQGDVGTVLSWNESTAVVTLNAVPGTWAVGDILWDKFDRYYTPSTGGFRAIAGAKAWIDPFASPGSENFMGTDRSLAPNSLQPYRMSLAGLDLKAGLIRLRSRHRAQRGVICDTAWVASPQFSAIEETVDASSIRDFQLTREAPNGAKLTVGLRGLQVPNGNGGVMNVVELPRLESGLVMMGPMEKKEFGFKMAFTDQLIRIDKSGGGIWKWLPSGITDSVTGETKPGYRAEGNMRIATYLKAPGFFAVGTGYFGV